MVSSSAKPALCCAGRKWRLWQGAARLRYLSARHWGWRGRHSTNLPLSLSH